MESIQEKKGGPYTKKQRLDRQNEVLKLHFEYGYPATKIADLMKINRNTINDDINQGYEQLSKDWNKYDIDSWLMRQIQRFESQRSRLLQELEKQENTKEKLAIEKMTFQIDCQIAQLSVNDLRRKDEIKRFALELVNHWAKKNKLELRVLGEKDIVITSPENRELIKKILETPYVDFELKEKQKSAGI